ncbi:MAG: TatD family hydrolase [Candidatus Cloacimonadota bacterium]|nr:TatD family hydrolase [Candidatus Cloacimonadota bacterium]
MQIFETHAHLDFPDFDKDRDDIIQSAYKEGVEYIVNIGVERNSCENSMKLAQKYEQIYAAVGFHPHNASEYDEDMLRNILNNKKVIAIGEIGLDYYRMLTPKRVQQETFEKQVALAAELNIPIVIHDREAHQNCLDILDKYNPKKLVFHCYTGDILFAEKILQRGWNISFTGIITYKNSHLSEVARIIPPDSYFVETDSPYLSPVPKRGKRNSPLHLRYIIEKLAEIRNVTPKMVAQQTYENACRFFLES